VGDVGAGPRRNGSGSGARRATSDPDLSVLVAGLGGRLARAALATGDLDGGWARAAELGCERPRRPHGRAVELGGLTSGQCRGRTSTDDSAPLRVGEMYRGERHCIFAPPLSSKVNCFTDLSVCWRKKLLCTVTFASHFSDCVFLLELALARPACMR
jgi:hypothetical protein